MLKAVLLTALLQGTLKERSFLLSLHFFIGFSFTQRFLGFLSRIIYQLSVHFFGGYSWQSPPYLFQVFRDFYLAIIGSSVNVIMPILPSFLMNLEIFRFRTRFYRVSHLIVKLLKCLCKNFCTTHES